jgi:KRAB domain-containing zinc finger protein
MTKIVLKKHKISDHESENGSFYTKEELDLNKLENHHLFYDDKVNCEASAPLTQARVFCSKCDRKFIDSSSLQRHVAFRHFPKKTARHMNLTSIPRNINLSDLNENSIPTVHEEKKPYKCSSCNAAFSLRYHLIRHVSGVHEDKKTFQCGTCQAKFLDEHELKGHIFAVHVDEKEKLHRFTRSNAALSRKTILDNYESGVHERPKNAKLTKSQTKSHEIIYAGENVFACKYCEKRFIKPNSVKYHELKSHFLERRRERANLEKH